MSIGTFFKSLTGAPKVLDNIFDKDKGLLTQVGEWVGNKKFTDEERAEFDRDTAKAVQQFAIATMGENTSRSTTRRELACQWFRMQINLIMLTVLCVFLDELLLFAGRESSLTATVSEITFSSLLWGVTSGIGLFFWGTHGLRNTKWSKDK